jgi:hypothetical protein
MDASLSNINVTLSFRKIAVLTAVFVFLALIPIFVIIVIRANNKKQIWAPMISACPDYWKLSKSKDGHIRCKPDKKNAEYSSAHGFFSYQLPTKMNKYEYAVQNKITWDGITNDDTLINNFKEEAPKSIFWLLGKVFTVQNNNSK